MYICLNLFVDRSASFQLQAYHNYPAVSLRLVIDNTYHYLYTGYNYMVRASSSYQSPEFTIDTGNGTTSIENSYFERTLNIKV